jgi:putative ABC transport system substrate-binding protein
MEYRMRRRELAALIAAAATASSIHRYSWAQERARIPRIGYLFSFKPAAGQHLWEACQQGLRALGYIEGQNIQFEPRWSEGEGSEKLAALAAELVRLKVDVIVTAATPATRAAKSATDSIPIVIVAVGDPVGSGIVASIARPGGNITGLSLLTPELGGNRLELLAEFRPLSRVAVLVNPDNTSHVGILEGTQATASKLGTTLHKLEARDTAEIERAFKHAKEESFDAFIVFDDPVLWSNRPLIVALAATLRIPTIYGYREFVDEGGLLSYGPDRPDLYSRTAGYVDKILKGAKPADLPIQQPIKFDLVINTKAASAIGLTVPPSLLVRADEVIE